MYLDVTLPDDAADMRLDKWLDKHMESVRNSEVLLPQTGRRQSDSWYWR